MLLGDAFDRFHKKCIEIYELDPANFLSAHRLAWKACLKITRVEFRMLICY